MKYWIFPRLSRRLFVKRPPTREDEISQERMQRFNGDSKSVPTLLPPTPMASALTVTGRIRSGSPRGWDHAYGGPRKRLNKRLRRQRELVNVFSNLYACDVSVFPVSPPANPSLALTALAIRYLHDQHRPQQTTMPVNLA